MSVRGPIALATLLLAVAAAPAPLDSQVVLERYAAAITRLKPTKNVVFTYTVSQAGPHNIEQTHRLYRSGNLVRDETLTVDGQSLKRKLTRIARYADRYAIKRLAPREAEYTMLLMQARRAGAAYRYTYEAIPSLHVRAFAVRQVTIDGSTYLPAQITFRTSNGALEGNGHVNYARSGGHWVPVYADVSATIDGKPARERITFSAYAFPKSFPVSTFKHAKPLPKLVIPTY